MVPAIELWKSWVSTNEVLYEGCPLTTESWLGIQHFFTEIVYSCLLIDSFLVKRRGVHSYFTEIVQLSYWKSNQSHMAPHYSFLQLKVHASHRIESGKESKITIWWTSKPQTTTSKCITPRQIKVPSDIPCIVHQGLLKVNSLPNKGN